MSDQDNETKRNELDGENARLNDKLETKGREDLEIVNPGSFELDFRDLTVEALEQRLELAIGKVFLPGPLEDCWDAFNCAGFGCAGGFNCTSFC